MLERKPFSNIFWRVQDGQDYDYSFGVNSLEIQTPSFHDKLLAFFVHGL